MSTQIHSQPFAPQIPLQRQDAVRNLPRVQTADQPRGNQAPQQVNRQPPAPQHVADTRKRITDTDNMLARIDRKLERLGIENPEKHQSFWSRTSGKLASFAKAVAVSLVNMPKMVGSATLSLLKVSANLVVNLPRLFTVPLRLVSSKPDEWMAAKVSTMNKGFDKAKSVVNEMFDGINSSIVRVNSLHRNGAMSEQTVGTLSDGASGVSDGALGIVNTQAGIYGTNIMDAHNFNINQNVNADHLGNFTTLNDGDQAMFRGSPGLVLNTGVVLGQMDDALTRARQGHSLIEDARQLERGPQTPEQRQGSEFIRGEGQDMIGEAGQTYARGGVGLVQNYVTAVNTVAGSNLYGAQAFGDIAVGVTNVTQIAGFGLTAVTATYDGVMDARSAHSGRVRKNRADDFLQNTAEMRGNRKTVESLDTSAVRDGVKLFRKNQNQSFWNKAMSSGRNFAIAAAAVTLAVATTVAAAATPVGWAIMGAAAVGAIGFGLYKVYKSVRREENIQRLGDRLQRVQAEIQNTPQGSQATATDRTRLQELQKLERTIQRYQRQTDPKAAAAEIVRVLNNPRSTDTSRNNAATALQTVFKINPNLLRENPPGTPLAGEQANRMARQKLEKKLGIFA